MTHKSFVENLACKLTDPLFRGDMTGLLRPGFDWDIDAAGAYVMQNVLRRLAGDLQ